MKGIKRGVQVLVVVVVLFIGYHHKIVHYGILQGIGQFKVLTNAKPLASFIADENFPDSLRDVLQCVPTIRSFAIDSLGLNYSDSYTKMYDHGTGPILWMVTASDRYEIKAYQWEYPLLGSLSYRGYFDRWRADSLAAKLQGEGYDVRISEVGGWSTLGWFDDPILSGMLKKGEAGLARLLIHELTHGTLYVPGATAFNENLATLVGDIGAEQYLISKYGPASKQVSDYEEFLVDLELFGSFMIASSGRLDSLYQAIDGRPAEIKDSLKSTFMIDLVATFRTQPFRTTKFSGWGKKRLPNNADFVSYLTYREHQNELKMEFEQDYKSDFKLFLAALKQRYGHAGS